MHKVRAVTRRSKRPHRVTGDVTAEPRRCLRFHGAHVGVLDVFRTTWERRPGVTATFHRLLNCEIGWLDCHVITTE